MIEKFFFLFVAPSIALCFVILFFLVWNLFQIGKKRQKRIFVNEWLQKNRANLPQLSETDMDWLAEILTLCDETKIQLFFQKIEIVETVFKEYTAKQPKYAIRITHLPYLRNALGFSTQNPFFIPDNTHQLHQGLKMQGCIETENGKHWFDTAILVNYEQEIWVDASSLPDDRFLRSEMMLLFVFQKEQQGFFQFRCKLVNLVRTPFPAIILAHSKTIESTKDIPIQIKKTKNLLNKPKIQKII